MVEIRLLGAVEVGHAGAVRLAGTPQERAVLAALAVDAGRVVGMSTLVDRVWGDHPPARARQAIWTRVAALRRTLDTAALVWQGGGYLLDVDPDAVDLLRFRALVARAGDPGRPGADQARQLEAALALWRGPALAGVPGDWAERMRASWELEQLQAMVAWADAELTAGNPEPVPPRLRDVLAGHPQSEPLAGVLMRALYATGHAADALRVYARLREQLAEELGTDPGPQLQQLHEAILRGDPDPSLPDAPRPGGPSAAPAQLPADVPRFVGRTAQLARLHDLVSPPQGQQATSPVICVLTGTAGVGKTTLAVHWAHTARAAFPDGQLYVNLRGFDPGGQPAPSSEVIRDFLDALGVPPSQIPLSAPAQVGLYRSTVAGRRLLIVLDNARDAEQVRPMLPGAPGCVVIVTSRDDLTGLLVSEGAVPVPVDLFAPDEARELIIHRIGRLQQSAADPAALETILSACARLPLALALAAARVAKSGFPLPQLAAELVQADQALDLLDSGDAATHLRAVFSWSYSILTPQAAALFRLLGLHPGPDISTAAAASLLGSPLPRTRRLLGELTRASLLTEHLPGRYAVHDLMRAYAIERCQGETDRQDRQQATVRMMDYYVHSAHTASRLLDPHRDPIELPLDSPVPGGAGPGTLAGQAQALAWLGGEHAVLLAVLASAVQGSAVQGSFDRHAWQLAWALHGYLDQRGLWHQLEAAWSGAARAAARLGHLPAQAYAQRGLHLSQLRLGRVPEAMAHLLTALRLYQNADDQAGQANTHMNLGYLWSHQQHYDQALDHALTALGLYRAAGHHRGAANALNSAGWQLTQLGQHGQALDYCQQARAEFRQLGDRRGEGYVLDSLGHIHQCLRHHDQAAACYQQSIALARTEGNTLQEAESLSHLADALAAAGDLDGAQQARQQALDLYTRMGHPRPGARQGPAPDRQDPDRRSVLA